MREILYCMFSNVHVTTLHIRPTHLCVHCSNKDEEVLKTYKNVYSKLLRAEKNAPLLIRVKLYIELLQQLTPQAGGDITHS